jgi:hypothetical protein
LAAAALACEVIGAIGPRRFPTLGDVIDWIMRARVGRLGVLLAWLWLGWHLFVR